MRSIHIIARYNSYPGLLFLYISLVFSCQSCIWSYLLIESSLIYVIDISYIIFIHNFAKLNYSCFWTCIICRASFTMLSIFLDMVIFFKTIKPFTTPLWLWFRSKNCRLGGPTREPWPDPDPTCQEPWSVRASPGRPGFRAGSGPKWLTLMDMDNPTGFAKTTHFHEY